MGEIVCKATEFVESSQLWDRSELLIRLESILKRKGSFVCVLAGRNTGKSLVFQTLATRHEAKVLLVDMRSNHSGILLSGLAHIFQI